MNTSHPFTPLVVPPGDTPQDTEPPDPKSWFGRREIAQKKYDGRLKFRAVSAMAGTRLINAPTKRNRQLFLMGAGMIMGAMVLSLIQATLRRA